MFADLLPSLAGNLGHNRESKYKPSGPIKVRNDKVAKNISDMHKHWLIERNYHAPHFKNEPSISSVSTVKRKYRVTRKEARKIITDVAANAGA